MPQSVRVLQIVEAILALGVAAGLLYRGRVRACGSFVAYDLTVVAQGVGAALWPDRVYNWQTWMAWQSIQVPLKLLILFELGSYIFKPFPGALAVMRGVIVLVLAATNYALLTLPAGSGLSQFAVKAGPIASQATTWGAALLLGLSTWYFVPMDAWRRAILTGLTIYGMLSTVTMAGLERWGWGARELLSYVNIGSYVALLVYWAFAAWRATSEDERDIEKLRAELPPRLSRRA